ncbi:MAG: HD domain-containing protein [Lachnospiraceae bacterium]|nr:HD domain-containing protein [Lachnospiraceae bacterium]MBQ8634315.1 HD domain-containing protein [Lachnospiraceae bacterium]
MRRIKTEQIRGHEILAKDIYSDGGVVLISEGTILKKDYVEKLLELKITDVFVEDEISREIQVQDITEEKIREQCSEKLEDTLERFSYASGEERRELSRVATEVMEGVLLQDEVIYTISNVRSHSKSLYEHSLSVAALAVLIAVRVGYSQTETKEIAMGALLHDIGFTSVKEKYQGLILSEQEEKVQKEIKRHVVYGYIEVEQQEWVPSVSREIILYHHERLDRSGYPFHMSGDKIKPQVRLVAICDAFDNMVYGNLEKRKKVHEALDEIMRNSGIKYDAELVKIFLGSVATYPTGSMVSLNTGKNAIVLRQNAENPTRPVVRLVEQSSSGEWKRKEDKDLSEELSLFIIDTIE